MPFDGKLMARARERLEKDRAANQAEQQRRLGAVYARVRRSSGWTRSCGATWRSLFA